MGRIRKARKKLTRHLMEAELLSDEHILRLAKQAVAKAHIPAEVMSYDECLASALYGIANGYHKFQEDQWHTTRDWLSMQAYYQIRTDSKKRSLHIQRETASENMEWAEAPHISTPMDGMISEENEKTVEKLLSILTRRERAIVKRICLGGESYSKVAKTMKMKRSEVIRVFRRSIDSLRAVALFAAVMGKEENEGDEQK